MNANDYETGQIDTAYSAAAAHGNFQLFYSFDLSYTWSQTDIVNIVSKYATNAVSYKWNNKVQV